MSSVTMRKLELILLRSDIDAVLEYLAGKRCFQVLYPEEPDRLFQTKSLDLTEEGTSEERPEEQLISESDLNYAQSELDFIGSFLGFELPQDIIENSQLPNRDMLSNLDVLNQRCEELKSQIEETEARIERLEEAIHEVKAVQGLEHPFEELEESSSVLFQIGKVAPSSIPVLAKMLGNRAVIVPLDDKGTVIAVSSREGRFSLETALSKVGFEKKPASEANQDVLTQAMEALEGSYQAEKPKLESLLQQKKDLSQQDRDLWRSTVLAVQLKKGLLLVENKLERTTWVYRLSGWVPEDKVDDIVQGLLAMLGDRISIRIYDPTESAAKVSKGSHGKEEEAVPVLFKHKRLVAAFQGIVKSYGTPAYGDIDPTPFVAVFFTLLFSIMFCDLGQGMVIVALGIAILKAKKGMLSHWTKYAHAFIAAGVGSMVMGLLVGSFFTNETVLIPLERVLTGFFLGRPEERFLQIMPKDNVMAMFYFFGFTVVVGVIINSTGLVINIINLIRRKEYGEALFSRTGLAGAFVFWWAMGLVIRLLLGGKLGLIDVVGFGIPLLAMVFSEPLKMMINKKQGKAPEEGQGGIIGGLVEVLDMVSYYASNTFSFLRVGAFALAHAVLSFVIFTMGSLMRGNSATGIGLELLIYLFGNAVIIVLEGLIVTIQTIRLQYYEFFSKFFTRSGTVFTPISFSGRTE